MSEGLTDEEIKELAGKMHSILVMRDRLTKEEVSKLIRVVAKIGEGEQLTGKDKRDIEDIWKRLEVENMLERIVHVMPILEESQEEILRSFEMFGEEVPRRRKRKIRRVK